MESVSRDGSVAKTSYTYDKVGNRLTKTDGLKTITYIYDENNRLLSEDDIKYNYDNNGNLIKKQSAEEISDYIYNAEGKLAEVNKTTKDGVETESYKYNLVGTRTQKTTNGKEINYLVDENTDYSRVLEEKDNTGKLVVSYTYGHDLISQNRENNISLYYKDGLGSTTALGNVNGEVTDTYVYDAFGNITEKTGITENSKKETRLRYLR